MTIFIIIISTLLSIYSYTQVDLNLTLINWSPYLSLQQYFTQLGFFMRPISGNILTILFLILPAFLLVLRSSISVRSLKLLILCNGIILMLGYTAFSHDLFNYIFDARIISLYGENPYAQKALDYPQDDWTRFMQWTHRTYPYGPGWLLITVVPSFLGMQKFLLTYFLFRLLFLFSYFLGAWSVYQILKLTQPDQKLARNALILFAFQPLILVESVLSPHLDAVMGSIGIFGIYLTIRFMLAGQSQKIILSQFILLFSATIKYATLPWLLITNRWFINRYGYRVLFSAIVFISFVMGIAQAISQTNYQPWYGLLAAMTLPILTPYVKLKYLVITGILLAVPMWIYVSFAYTGEWASAIPIF